MVYWKSLYSAAHLLYVPFLINKICTYAQKSFKKVLEKGINYGSKWGSVDKNTMSMRSSL